MHLTISRFEINGVLFSFIFYWKESVCAEFMKMCLPMHWLSCLVVTIVIDRMAVNGVTGLFPSYSIPNRLWHSSRIQLRDIMSPTWPLTQSSLPLSLCLSNFIIVLVSVVGSRLKLSNALFCSFCIFFSSCYWTMAYGRTLELPKLLGLDTPATEWTVGLLLPTGVQVAVDWVCWLLYLSWLYLGGSSGFSLELGWQQTM